MADISVVVGMDKTQFDQGLREVKAQAAAASGSIGQSFSVAGAKMQGLVQPFKQFNQGLQAAIGVASGLAGAVMGVASAYMAVSDAIKEATGVGEEFLRQERELSQQITSGARAAALRGATDEQKELARAAEDYAKRMEELGRVYATFSLLERMNGDLVKERLATHEQLAKQAARELQDRQKEIREQAKRKEEEAESQKQLNEAIEYELSLRHNMKQIKDAGAEQERQRVKEEADFAAAYNESERHMNMVQFDMREDKRREESMRPTISAEAGLLGAGLTAQRLGVGDSIPAESLRAQREFHAQMRSVPMKLQEVINILTRQPLAGGARA